MNAVPLQTVSLSCGDLSREIQQKVKPWLTPAATLSLLLVGGLMTFNAPHLGALLCVLAGVFLPIAAWCSLKNPGIPLICLIAVQTFAIFGTPILTRNPSLNYYPAGDTFDAAFEVLVFCCALTAGWRLAIGHDTPATPGKLHWGLTIVRLERPAELARAALFLLASSTVYQALLATGHLDAIVNLLPGGAFSIVRTLFESAALAGCLLGGYTVGSRAMNANGQVGFWLLFAAYFLLKASSVLLSSTMGVVAAVALGFFLGARRPPVIFLLVIGALASFLNLGKFEMRAKYWNDSGLGEPPGLVGLPDYFAEWAGYSIGMINQNRNLTLDEEKVGQELTDRLNNLQNLLYAQDAIQRRGVPLLGGETYLAIPSLLIPRVLWPNKPRTHEGQILLNVHFGRQSLDATFTTYIAWGLLAEAYGNFGAFWGALLCGLVLGLVAGALERWIRAHPVTSLEAFFYLLITVSFSLSFEMVASVWITSLFQMIVALVASVAAFAKRQPTVFAASA